MLRRSDLEIYFHKIIPSNLKAKRDTNLRIVRPNAVSFEIDLRGVEDDGHSHRKIRYVFICAGQLEATEWLQAVQAVIRRLEQTGGG